MFHPRRLGPGYLEDGVQAKPTDGGAEADGVPEA